ncbi:MAG: hypothetical protein Q4A74_07570 [Cardiobacteriaceae bacterium]|nr:hypothetical protein [Cardiobacteriaceae bacterium]
MRENYISRYEDTLPTFYAQGKLQNANNIMQKYRRLLFKRPICYKSHRRHSQHRTANIQGDSMTISLLEKQNFVDQYNGQDDELLDRLYAVFHKVQHVKGSLLLNLAPPTETSDEAYFHELQQYYDHYRSLEFIDAAIREVLTGEDYYERLMAEPLTLERFLALLKGFKHEFAQEKMH